MGYLKYLDEIIETKLLGLHTAYLAKVISVSGNTAKIQPLGLYQNQGEKEEKQSVLTAVPIMKNVKKFKLTTISVCEGSWTGYQPYPREAGDIAVCICCERNITEAKKGKNVLPPVGHHQMSDSIIIGIL